MLAATRVTLLNETFDCELEDYTCRATSNTVDTIYIPDIERFTVRVLIITRRSSNVLYGS